MRRSARPLPPQARRQALTQGLPSRAPSAGAGRAAWDTINKRSVATEGYGMPLGIASASANRRDSPLLASTLHAASAQLDHLLLARHACHLDRGYDIQPTVSCLSNWASAPRSPERASPLLSRPAPDGSSSARIHE